MGREEERPWERGCATGFSPVQKKLAKSTKLQRRRSAWVGLADFEKIEEKKGSRFRSCHD